MNVAMAFVRAINRQDVEALVGLMTPAHRFIDSLGNVVTGREAMRAGWTAYFKMVPDYSVAIEETLTDGSVVVMLGVAQGTYTMDGTLREENRWQTPVAVRAATEDGLLAEWRVSADNEPMRLIMARCS
jgi:ketosteroid isomerase-like protein